MGWGAGRGGASVLLALLLAVRAAAQPAIDDTTLVVDTIATQLAAPVAMAFLAPDDLLVLEKNSGRVRRVLHGVVQPVPVLDVAVNGDSERGLLGIAVNSETPPRVFLFYTEVADPDGDGLPDAGAPLGNRVYRYTWNAVAGRLEARTLLLDLPATPGPNHNGGALLLGPTPAAGADPTVGDGSLLHVAIGDLNRGGQLENNPAGAAPDDTGVLLRVRQDGSAAPGNPFVPYCSVTTAQPCAGDLDCPAGEHCRTAVARYFAYGVRNSFGLAIDPVTGRLWDTENGPGSYDEINLVAPGFNSGWTPLMGPDARDAQGVGQLFAMPGGASAYSDPEFSWQSPVAVTAIVFPAGGALGAAYEDVALVGDFNHGQLYRLPLDATRTGFDLGDVEGLADLVADSAAERDRLRLGRGFGGIADLEPAPDGSLYIVSVGHGAIYRLRARHPPTPTPTAIPTPTPYAVSGAVRLFAGDHAVSDVVLTASGAGTISTATASDGRFAAAPLPAGNWTLTPRRSGGVGGAISSLDAVYALEFVSGLRPLSPAQRLACDVTGEGSCSALDAVRILERAAGLLDSFAAAQACDSDWLFLPIVAPAANQTALPPLLSAGGCAMGRLVWAPLVDSLSERNFIAIPLGDVTGNWRP